MSIEGQGHFFTIYFPGFVCFVLYLAKISGERLQDHWPLVKTNFTYVKNFVLMALSLLHTYMLLESPHRREGILAKGKFVYRLPRTSRGSWKKVGTLEDPD